MQRLSAILIQVARSGRRSEHIVNYSGTEPLSRNFLDEI